jgi:L-aminopeptidase/D-esterase-like protein
MMGDHMADTTSRTNPRPGRRPRRAGPDHGSLVDVSGIAVGHTDRASRGWLTGTTVVLCGPGGACAGVDVRGGGPGTRETDLLRPENLVQRVHAVCLSGGSAFGLAAADGVMQHLAAASIGFPVGEQSGWVVPIVPSAVIFDLGRGGSFDARPDASFGRLAAERATSNEHRLGCIGAGLGARAGGIKGGIGQASVRLTDGTTVAALAVTNPSGSVIDPATGLPYAAGGFGLRPPDRADRRRFSEHVEAARRPLNTVIGVVATDARLTKAESTRVAMAAQDGIARAVRPAHTPFDGDAVFALATGDDPLVDTAEEPTYASAGTRQAWLSGICAAAADVFATATAAGVVYATAKRGIPAYRDLCPSAFRDWHYP